MEEMKDAKSSRRHIFRIRRVGRSHECVWESSSIAHNLILFDV